MVISERRGSGHATRKGGGLYLIPERRGSAGMAREKGDR